MYIVFGLGAFQSIIFSLLLITKKGKHTADKYLAGFFFVITLYLLNIYSVKFDIWKKFPEIIAIITLVSLTYGPLLFFYVSSLIGQKVFPKHILLHAIPVSITFLIIFPFLFYSKEEKLLYFTDKFINLPLNVSIGTFIQYLSAPIYFIWTIIRLKKYKQHLKNYRSSIEKINLQWMRKLLYGVITIWFIDCLNVYALNFTDFNIPNFVSWYIKYAFIAFILIIGYYGVNQGSVFAVFPSQNFNNNTQVKDERLKRISDRYNFLNYPGNHLEPSSNKNSNK